MDIGAAFPRLAFLAVTMVAVGGATLWFVARGTADAPIRSLAVLPLESFAAQDDQDYFAAGMHEALISQLTQLGLVRVISRTSVVSYDRTGKSMTQIGEELGVEGVVEGSVLVDGGQVRITVQLIHAPSDTHLFSQDYEREMTDVISLQREVAQEIALMIQGELDGSADQVLAGMEDPMGPADPEAVMEEMKGRMAMWGGTEVDYREVQSHFHEALRQDSTFVPALVGLAGAEVMMGLDEENPSPEFLESALEWVARALELYPDSPDALEIASLIDGLRFEAREVGPVLPAPPDAAGVVSTEIPTSGFAVGDEGTRLVFLDDSMSSAFPTVTEWGTRIGARLGSVQALGSRGPPAKVMAARRLEGAGEHDAAVTVLLATVETNPDFEPAWAALEHLYVRREHFDQVVGVRRSREAALGGAQPGFPTAEELARALEVDAIDGYWWWRLSEIEALTESGTEVSNVERATAYAAVADNDLAIEYLRRAVRDGDRGVGMIRTDPVWDALRGDERFRQIQRQVMRLGSSVGDGRGDGRGGRRGGPGN